MRLRERLSVGFQTAQELARHSITVASAAHGQAQYGMAVAQAAYEQGQYSQLPQRLRALLEEKADMAALQAAGFGAIGETLAKRQREARAALISLSAPVRARVLLALREAVKAQAVSDPDMWPCVRRRVGGIVDLFWDDLTVYIETAAEDTRQAALGRVADIRGLAALGDERWHFRPRTWVLYHYLPFDLSTFGQIKDPAFWLLTVISLIPAFGIRVCFFLILLLLLLAGCPADEYQLVQYILMFKGTQFLSSGIGMAMFASVKYYLCVHPGGHHTCDTDGPGVSSDLVSSIIDFVGSCLLVWVAFVFLPCSRPSAGLRELQSHSRRPDSPERGEQAAAAAAVATSAPGGTCCCGQIPWDRQRGGRLAGLLGYDLGCFLLSCGVLAGLAYADAARLRPGGQEAVLPDKASLLSEVSSWQFRAAVFWARMFYSLLALPFTVFYLPGLNGILTHTTATGFNRNGQCVPYMLWPMEEAALVEAVGP